MARPRRCVETLKRYNDGNQVSRTMTKLGTNSCSIIGAVTEMGRLTAFILRSLSLEPVGKVLVMPRHLAGCIDCHARAIKVEPPVTQYASE